MKPFSTYNIGQKCCCRKCAGAYFSKRKKITVQCLTCKKPFPVNPSEISEGRGKYCSRHCSHNRPRKWKSEEALDLWGQGFSARQISIKLGSSESAMVRFLRENVKDFSKRPASGPQCYSWKGGVKISDEIYKRIRERAQDKCENCGYNQYPKILQIHHKDRNRKHNTDENLILLCPNCHHVAHLLTISGPYRNRGATSI